ncbi:crossover junction endodeoxyribonuclease RuvC [Candidatus Uhrbacteria bacterium]|nr:crossover junction endodeoxyribonuclease RuvC [Candidatus Uhrbacteria bacterium]
MRVLNPVKPRIILGLDPGLARVGYGIIRVAGNSLSCLSFGCIETHSTHPLSQRLEELYRTLSSLIGRFSPHTAAVEKIFFAKNTKTALDVSHARGVIILALAHAKIPVFECTPLQVKQAVTGYGKAEKQQIKKMVQLLLSLSTVPRSDDAADALAIALCASNNQIL